MLLSALFEAIPEKQRGFALHLFEAASDPLSHSDIRSALSDQLDDMHPGACCVHDVFGDDQSGDVVYSQYDPKGGGNQMYKAPYSLGTTNGKRTAEIDEDSKTNVVPRTTYEEEADDDDSMVSTESRRITRAAREASHAFLESLVRAKLYSSIPVYERFISKSERDAADAGSFAGKGKSFPILKPGDVMAAVRSMGRAGSDNLGTSSLKKNIIAIAKKKGWAKYLPKAWQGGAESSNSDDNSNTSEGLKFRFADDTLRLCETSVASLERIVLKEAKADYPIKLIAPGPGSSAFYPKEVLQRDGPKVFKAGTHVYLNHPTAAEESARPEGDVKNLAGVLTTDAVYHESHPQGPGLYGRMKVFADHAQTVEEKAPHVGMSIRASGKAESGTRKNGLPVLTELTSAESVDVVTRAGAGGMILNEAARSANSNQEVESMTAEEVTRLVESAVAKATKQATAPLRERLLVSDATNLGIRLMETIALTPEAKQYILSKAIGDGSQLPIINGELDERRFTEAVNTEMKAVGALLSSMNGGGRVINMGNAPTETELKESRKREKEDKKALKEARREARGIFEELGLPSDAAKYAARGREVA
jgi:hypothetical protein